MLNRKATPESTKKLKNTLTSFYKDYEGELDAKVTAKLLALYAQKTPAEFYLQDLLSSVM